MKVKQLVWYKEVIGISTRNILLNLKICKEVIGLSDTPYYYLRINSHEAQCYECNEWMFIEKFRYKFLSLEDAKLKAQELWEEFILSNIIIDTEED